MNYSEMFKKSFSSVSPVKNDDELLKSVLERTGKMENKKKMSLKKPLIAVCAAVIAITMATVTVGAATDWHYFNVFNEFFGDKVNDIKNNIVPEGEYVENSLEELDIKLSAVAADDKAAIAILDITSKNDPLALYMENDIYEIQFNQKYNLNVEFDGIGAGAHWGYTGKAINENRIRIPLRLSANTNITGKTIKITVYDENNHNRKWSAEFNVDIENNEFIYKTNSSFKMEVMNRDDLEEFVKKQTTGDYEEKYMDAFISEVRATPITLHLKGIFPVNYIGVSSNNESCAVTDNGDRITFHGTGNENGVPEGSEYYNDIYIELSEPINPEELKSIIFCGIEVPIKQ